MGLASTLVHKLLTVVVKAVILWIAFMFVFNIPVDKAGWVMICAFGAEVAGSLVASLLVRGANWGV